MTYSFVPVTEQSDSLTCDQTYFREEEKRLSFEVI